MNYSKLVALAAIPPVQPTISVVCRLRSPSPGPRRLGDWHDEADAHAFYRLLQETMGAERVSWSQEGFNGLRSVGGGRQLPLLKGHV